MQESQKIREAAVTTTQEDASSDNGNKEFSGDMEDALKRNCHHPQGSESQDFT
jgi:hypothetical protein